MLILVSFVPASGNPEDWVSFAVTVLGVSTSSRVSRENTLLYVNTAVMWFLWYSVSYWIKSWIKSVLFLNVFFISFLVYAFWWSTLEILSWFTLKKCSGFNTSSMHLQQTVCGNKQKNFPFNCRVWQNEPKRLTYILVSMHPFSQKWTTHRCYDSCVGITHLSMLGILRDSVTVHFAEVSRADPHAAGVKNHVLQTPQAALRGNDYITWRMCLQTHKHR